MKYRNTSIKRRKRLKAIQKARSHLCRYSDRLNRKFSECQTILEEATQRIYGHLFYPVAFSSQTKAPRNDPNPS